MAPIKGFPQGFGHRCSPIEELREVINVSFDQEVDEALKLVLDAFMLLFFSNQPPFVAFVKNWVVSEFTN